MKNICVVLPHFKFKSNRITFKFKKADICNSWFFKEKMNSCKIPVESDILEKKIFWKKKFSNHFLSIGLPIWKLLESRFPNMGIRSNDALESVPWWESKIPMMLSYPYPEGNHGSPKRESGSSGSESGNHDSNNGHPFFTNKNRKFTQFYWIFRWSAS